MQENVIKVDGEWCDLRTRASEKRKRVSAGELLGGYKRVRLYRNNRGEILIQPLVEIPASELWLFQNRDTLESIQKGLADAMEGKISKLDLEEL